MSKEVDGQGSLACTWLTIQEDSSLEIPRALVKDSCFFKAVHHLFKGKPVIDNLLSVISSELFLVYTKLWLNLFQGLKKILHLHP